MARSHLASPLLMAGLAAAIGCGGGGSGMTGGAGGEHPTSTSSATGTGGAGTTTSSSSSVVSSSSSSTTTSSSTSSGTGGTGTGGAGTGGMTTGTGGAGTGGAGTGGMGTGGTGGMIDPSTLDQDGDGWTPAQGDCCDVPNANCQKPEAVNPGAFEYPGNGVDDDCDPTTPDNAPPTQCSTAAKFGSVTAVDLLQAMDLCRFADAVPATPKDNKWGVINGSPQLVLADGTTALPATDNVQTGVMTSFGTYVTPQKYATMAAISSGTARAPTDPSYVHPQNGKLASQTTGNYNGQTKVKIQDVYLTPNGGKPPSPSQCPACVDKPCTTSSQCASGVTCTGGYCGGKICDQAFDSVNLRASIRVPTNARSFSYQFKFFSAEFPEYLCQAYNDFFVALLKSSSGARSPRQPAAEPAAAGHEHRVRRAEEPGEREQRLLPGLLPAVGLGAGHLPVGHARF
ncbi:MAG: hypothetical protein QM820_52455 [Minicystis sp.]